MNIQEMLARRLILLPLFLVGGCLPNIYLIDRPTLMEEEAAGRWPDLTEVFEKKQVTTSPVPLTPQQVKRKNDRVMQTLAGEFEPQPKSPKK